MIDHDAIAGLLARLDSPTHAAPASPLQLAAMYDPAHESDARPRIEFHALEKRDLATLRDTMQQLELDAKLALELGRRIERRRKTGQEYLYRATAALAPVNRFPAEVLARIFVLGKHLELNYSLRMSWVAQRWRNVALSTPELWSTIPLTGTTRVAAYLDRSGSMLLDIQADLRTYQVNVFEIGQCMKLLEPHRLRWRDVTILLEDHDQSQPILRQLEGICADVQTQSRLPYLNSIYFGVASSYPQISGHYSSSLSIPEISSLRVIELLGVDLLFSPSSNSDGFRQVVRLSLADIHHMHLKSHFLHALSAMPNLAELVLDQCNFIMPSLVDDDSHIRLERLRLVQLSLMPDEVVNVIVKKLQAPNLRRLELLSHELSGPSQTLDWDTIRSTYTSISVLKLNAITSYATQFVLQWLTELSCLRTLSIIFREGLSLLNAEKSSEQIVRRLADVRNQCCPQLCALEIGILATGGIATLRSMLDSRPLLKSGRVTIVLHSEIEGVNRNKDIAWMKAHLERFKIRAGDAEDETDDESINDS